MQIPVKDDSLVQCPRRGSTAAVAAASNERQRPSRHLYTPPAPPSSLRRTTTTYKPASPTTYPLSRGRVEISSFAMSYFFSTPVDIDVVLDATDDRSMVDVKLDKNRREKAPLYMDGESVKGAVTVRPKDGKRLEHTGIKVQFIGTIGTRPANSLSLCLLPASQSHLTMRAAPNGAMT
ncbi:hypothetical protein NLG97_g10052 [Lecanicillium saksenae]|uniref:Uncharacterized protein n=1 Tax=Lecanicillium saksenae TaxID=468837 RepID=A0ACC1QET6_9HYPO|nr:hypothetical protein NLG97_g10052 [Lecanicillium saksenae]